MPQNVPGKHQVQAQPFHHPRTFQHFALCTSYFVLSTPYFLSKNPHLSHATRSSQAIIYFRANFQR
jgi:hypothetical protein